MTTHGQKLMQWAIYTNRIEKLPSVALRFIMVDAQEAIDACPDGINADYYTDEIKICSSELRNRARKMCNREEEYVKVLAEMFMILREAGYDSNDMVDDLRDLVNDSQRPAVDPATIDEDYECPRCGENYPRDEHFVFMEYCPECGHAIDENAINENTGDDDDEKDTLSTEELIAEVATSVATWWRRSWKPSRNIELKLNAYEALEYLYREVTQQ